jgi:hypothetical protein
MEMPNRHQRRAQEAIGKKMAKQNGSRIALPNTIEAQFRHQPMPLVGHQMQAIPVPGGVIFQTVGGMDLATWMAGCWIASGKVLDGEEAIDKAISTLKAISERQQKMQAKADAAAEPEAEKPAIITD